MSETDSNRVQPEPELTEFQRAQRILADAERALFANPPAADPFEGQIRIGTST